MIGWLFHNIAKPAQLAMRRYMSQRIDHKLDVHTTDESVAAHLGADLDTFRNTQRALGWSGAARVIRHTNLGPDDVFLDIGCGAGRVLCSAARTAARRVIGLDIDPRMADLARNNLTRLRGRQAAFEVVAGDATSYVVPQDVTCVFLYNPFQGEILSTVLANVIASADRSPRRVRLIYAHPFEHERVTATGRFTPRERIHLAWRPNEKWAIKLAVQFYNLDGRAQKP